VPGPDPTNDPTTVAPVTEEPATSGGTRRGPSAMLLALLPFVVVAGTVFAVTRAALPGSDAVAGAASGHRTGPAATDRPAAFQMGMERGSGSATGAGTAAAGTAPVASGTMTSLVPNIVGLPLDEAVRILKAEGMSIGVVLGKMAPALPGAIIGQEPEAGSRLGHHRVINITLSTGSVEASHASMGGGGVSCRISAEEPDEAYCLTTKLFKY
jgi:PASTA domain